MSTKISKRVGFDNMSITGKMISGATVKFSIGRTGEKLEAGLSNDELVMKKQFAKLTDWLKFRKGENNQDRFDRLEKVLIASTNSVEFIDNLDKF